MAFKIYQNSVYRTWTSSLEKAQEWVKEESTTKNINIEEFSIVDASNSYGSGNVDKKTYQQ